MSQLNVLESQMSATTEMPTLPPPVDANQRAIHREVPAPAGPDQYVPDPGQALDPSVENKLAYLEATRLEEGEMHPPTKDLGRAAVGKVYFAHNYQEPSWARGTVGNLPVVNQHEGTSDSRAERPAPGQSRQPDTLHLANPAVLLGYHAEATPGNK